MPVAIKIGKGWADSAKIVSPFYNTLSGTDVLEASDYARFKLDIRNRPISEEKVHFFMKQFKAGKFFMKEFPGVVDKNFIILDGQHRYEAVRRLEMPYYFRFADSLTINDVVDVQLNAGWKTQDFIHAFIKQDNMNYIILSRFTKKYKISISLAAMLLSGNYGVGLGKIGFYNGAFKVKDESMAHKHANAIHEIGELALGLHRDRAFGVAITKIMTNPDYEHKRMVNQMTKYSSLMRRHMTTENYVRNLEEVYNYKLFTKNKIRFI